MRFRPRAYREEPEINFIPLIDVLLVILIFLMVTTTYSRYAELQINLPTADATGQPERSSQIDVVVDPGTRAMIPTGVAVAIPEGHAGLVLPRSGLASKQGLTLANAPGLIDAGYRGEVICAVVNLDSSEKVEIHIGDRIAQLVVVAIPDVAGVWAEELPSSPRGEGGFGSTGTT